MRGHLFFLQCDPSHISFSDNEVAKRTLSQWLFKYISVLRGPMTSLIEVVCVDLYCILEIVCLLTNNKSQDLHMHFATATIDGGGYIVEQKTFSSSQSN